jgi:hypothetical protein
LQTVQASIRRRLVLLFALAGAVFFSGCVAIIPFSQQPADGYTYGSGAPLRVAVIDDASGDWTQAIGVALQTYSEATPYLQFQSTAAGANIVVDVRDYRDSNPPVVPGYLYPWGVGGFAAVYDVDGAACNYPPATVPVNCNGEIARAEVYLNDAIPAGPDIETRRERLVLHELGHALGLTRHSPDLDIAQLARRYGWPEQ